MATFTDSLKPIKSMKISQYFPLVVSSLVFGGGSMLLVPPAQSLTFINTITNTTSLPQIGIRFVFGGLDGRPLTINSLTSPQLPLTQINNNNTTQVNVSIVGGVVQPGEPINITFDFADYPDGTAGVRGIDAARILATPTGVEEETLPNASFSATASAGAQTPFSAYRIGSPGDFSVSTFQAPGDQLTFLDATFNATFLISTQAIPGYVPFDQLNNFGPPIEITFSPGNSTTVTNTQPLQPTTPEPSAVASLSALSLGALLKRKLRAKPDKPL